MKEAKDRGEDCYDPNHPNATQTRDQFRLNHRPPWQKRWSVWNKASMYQLQRVSGDVRGFGSFSFAFAFGGREFHCDVDESTSMSSGSLSPDFGGMWRNGCPKSPDWDSDIDIGPEGDEISEDDTRRLQQVCEALAGKCFGLVWILGMS